MPNRAVLDSNIIAAMAFEEDASDRAMKAAKDFDPITLDLAIAEVGNVAWKQVVLVGENKQRALDALQDAMDFISTCDIIQVQSIVAEAYEISLEDKIDFYDSLFLAAAMREQVPLLTLDRKLYEKMKEKRDVRMI